MPLPTFSKHNNIQLAIQPNIGLDASARQSVVAILNILLADEAVLSSKTHCGDEHPGENSSSDLQFLFDAQCQQMQAISKEIVERVQILGGLHLSSAQDLIQSARLDGSLVIPGVLSILADHEAYIRFLREDTQKCSELYEDQGSFALLVSILRKHEKMAWMLRSYIKNEPVHGESQKRIEKDE